MIPCGSFHFRNMAINIGSRLGKNHTRRMSKSKDFNLALMWKYCGQRMDYEGHDRSPCFPLDQVGSEQMREASGTGVP